MVRPVDRLTAKIASWTASCWREAAIPWPRRVRVSGPVASDFRMERMMLVLHPDSVQEQALQKLMGIDWSDGHRSLDASFKECVLDYCSFVRIDLRKCAFKDCRMLEVISPRLTSPKPISPVRILTEAGSIAPTCRVRTWQEPPTSWSTQREQGQGCGHFARRCRRHCCHDGDDRGRFRHGQPLTGACRLGYTARSWHKNRSVGGEGAR